jgi:hypothetical protein
VTLNNAFTVGITQRGFPGTDVGGSADSREIRIHEGWLLRNLPEVPIHQLNFDENEHHLPLRGGTGTTP